MKPTPETSPFGQTPPQSVQPVRNMSAERLRAACAAAGHRFVHAVLGDCASKAEVMAAIAQAFEFHKSGSQLGSQFGANFDALYDCLTDLPAVPDHGYAVLLEAIPITRDLDTDARETLLDVFRDAAEFHIEDGLPLRVYYSFR